MMPTIDVLSPFMFPVDIHQGDNPLATYSTQNRIAAYCSSYRQALQVGQVAHCAHMVGMERRRLMQQAAAIVRGERAQKGRGATRQ